jgi:hypothetical protein
MGTLLYFFFRRKRTEAVDEKLQPAPFVTGTAIPPRFSIPGPSTRSETPSNLNPHIFLSTPFPAGGELRKGQLGTNHDPGDGSEPPIPMHRASPNPHSAERRNVMSLPVPESSSGRIGTASPVTEGRSSMVAHIDNEQPPPAYNQVINSFPHV